MLRVNSDSSRPPQDYQPPATRSSSSSSSIPLFSPTHRTPKPAPVLPPEPIRSQFLKAFLEKGEWLSEGDEEYTLIQLLTLKIVEPVLCNPRPEKHEVLSCYTLMNIAMGVLEDDDHNTLMKECFKTLDFSEARQKTFFHLIRYTPCFDKTIATIISGKEEPPTAQREFHLLADVHSKLFSLSFFRTHYFLDDLKEVIDTAKDNIAQIKASASLRGGRQKKRGGRNTHVAKTTQVDGEELILEFERKVTSIERLMRVRQRVSRETFLLLNKLSNNASFCSPAAIDSCLHQLQKQRTLLENQISALHTFLSEIYTSIIDLCDTFASPPGESAVTKFFQFATEKAKKESESRPLPAELLTMLESLGQFVRDSKQADREMLMGGLQKRGAHISESKLAEYFSTSKKIFKDMTEQSSKYKKDVFPYFDRALLKLQQARDQLSLPDGQGSHASWIAALDAWDEASPKPKKVSATPKKSTGAVNTQKEPSTTVPTTPPSVFSTLTSELSTASVRSFSPLEMLRETSHLFEVQQKKAIARISHKDSSRFGQTVLSDDKESPAGRVKLTLPMVNLKSDGETDGQSGRTVCEKYGLAHISLPDLENGATYSAKLAQKEVLTHLFFSQCGYELFFRAIKEGNLEAFATILPSLILDWHVQIEQIISCHYIAKTGQKPQSHHLTELVKQLGKELPVEGQDHVQRLDNGLIWSRYPVHSSTHYAERERATPEALEWITWTSELASKITNGSQSAVDDLTIQKLGKLLSFVVSSHHETLRLISLESDGSNAVLEQFAKNSLPLESETRETLTTLKGRPYASFMTRPRPKSPFFEQVTSYQNDHRELAEMTFGNPFTPLKEAGALFQRQEHALEMLSRHPDPYFLAWHYRNSLHFQRVFEQLYISQGITRDIGLVMTHRFENFHEILGVSKPQDADFDCKGGIHYPHIQGSYDSPHIARLLELTKRSKNCAAEGFSYKRNPDPREMDDFAQQVEKILARGHSLATKHFTRALADLKKAPYYYSDLKLK